MHRPAENAGLDAWIGRFQSYRVKNRPQDHSLVLTTPINRRGRTLFQERARLRGLTGHTPVATSAGNTLPSFWANAWQLRSRPPACRVDIVQPQSGKYRRAS